MSFFVLLLPITGKNIYIQIRCKNLYQIGEIRTLGVDDFKELCI